MIPTLDSKLRTVEQLFARHGRSSSPVYSITILFIAVVLIWLPFHQLDLAVRGEGSFRPVIERLELRARSSGYVEAVLVRENERVASGSILFRMRSPGLDERRRYLAERSGKLQADVTDLGSLLKLASGESAAFVKPHQLNPLWRQEWEHHEAELAELILKKNRSESEWRRSQKLQAANLLAVADAEVHSNEKDRANAAVETLQKHAFLKWQAQCEDKSQQLDALKSEADRVASESELLTVRAPSDGFVDQLGGITPGTHLQAGDRLAVLSPDQGLQAEIFVETRDVAHVYVGQLVRLQVDAFPYAEWGWLPAKVSSLSEDAVVVGGRARFRALVRPLKSELQLKSGSSGRVQRGMSLQARFMGRKRSLWRILVDRTAAWWDPV